jgi:serine phosphatase RsbU (regulator of sigma subunit)
MRLRVRFALAMTLALSGVMLVAAFLLYQSTAKLVRDNQERAFVEALHTLNDVEDYEQIGTAAMELDRGMVRRFKVGYGPEHKKSGYLYQLIKKKDAKVNLIAPADVVERTGKGLLGLVIGVTVAVILIGTLVAFAVGNQVTRPLDAIVEDIRQISRGDLKHRTRVRAGGEIAMLAKSIDRMAGNLHDAQEAEIELSVRERELSVASEVQEALLPQSTPDVAGFEVGGLHVGSPSPGGDFHDFIELADGRLGLLVCEVSGRGIPGALVGATARSYLRAELVAGAPVEESLSKVNRQLARDVRRGMYVTAMYVLLDPQRSEATVACAGHKTPILRFTAEDKKVRLVQPEGIALGFDKGPVFDNTLKAATVELAPGDRLVLFNGGPLQVVNGEGVELGEKPFYRSVLQLSPLPTADMLARLKRALETYADGEPFPNDIALSTLSRKA